MKVLQCNRELSFSLSCKSNITPQAHEACATVFLLAPSIITNSFDFEMTRYWIFFFFWLLIHSNCPYLSFTLRALCLCVFSSCFGCQSLSEICSVHIGGEGGAWSPGGKGGERRKRRSCTYFPALTFTIPLRYRVINRGFPLSPTGSARCRGIRRHERTKSKSHQCQVANMMIPSVSAPWDSEAKPPELVVFFFFESVYPPVIFKIICQQIMKLPTICCACLFFTFAIVCIICSSKHGPAHFLITDRLCVCVRVCMCVFLCFLRVNIIESEQ